jgi:general secretion pathway protein D
MRHSVNLILLAALALSITAYSASAGDGAVALPLLSRLSADTTPAVETPTPEKLTEEPLWQDFDEDVISLNVNNMPLPGVLQLIADQTSYNLVVSSNIEGAVTIQLNRVPLEQALGLILDMHGYIYIVEDKNIRVMSQQECRDLLGYIPGLKTVRIAVQYADAVALTETLLNFRTSRGTIVAEERTNSLIVTDTPGAVEKMQQFVEKFDQKLPTQVFTLNYADPVLVTEKLIYRLYGERIILSVPELPTSVNGKDGFAASTSSTVTTRGSYVNQHEIDMAPKMAPWPQELVIGNARIQVDYRSRKIVMTDIPTRIEQAAALIKSLDVPDKQVVIEAVILQVDADNSLGLGIDWQFIETKLTQINTGLSQTQVSGLFPALDDQDEGGFIRLGKIGPDNFQAVLEMLEEQRNARLLSRPRVRVVSNEEAKILVGKTIPYRVTDTRESNGVIYTFDKVIEVEVGVRLFVTPIINDMDRICMRIHPEVSSVLEFIDGIPVVETRQIDTEIISANGETIVIGGLIKEENIKTVSRLPLLGHIPIIKHLFSSTKDSVVKTELIIFITSKIKQDVADEEDKVAAQM